MSGATSRHFAIWQSRIYREIDKCAECPDGIALHDVHVAEPAGICVARFHCFVPFQPGSQALLLIPRVTLEIAMPFALDHAACGIVQYPFCAPIVRATDGYAYVPHELRDPESSTEDGKSAEAPHVRLRLTTLQHWSPSTTLVMILQDFVRSVQQFDPQPSTTPQQDAAASSASAANPRPSKTRMRLRKRDIRGTIYRCQEVDARTGTLRAVPMLLQSRNIILLASMTTATKSNAARRDNAQADEDAVIVDDLIPLKDVARITPQKGKSITLFFRDRNARCRTLLTPQTSEIVADIQQMIRAVGAKRTRDDRAHRDGQRSGSNEDSSGALSQLLSFLTTDQTEKAKEVSHKIADKLSRFGSSVSRFLRRDDSSDDHMDAQTGLAAPVPAFEEIARLKTIFFRHPSRARMMEIADRYQQLAEEQVYRNARNDQVERAIVELQSFIEHPVTQRILTEVSVADHHNQGIRVRSA